MQRGLAVLGSFKKILDSHNPQSMRVCGTEALRLASNSNVFLQKAEAIIAHPIDIISGEEEARLSLKGVLAGLEDQVAGIMLLADVGGGSTELVLTESPSGNIRVASINMGVVGLTEQFISGSTPDIAPLDKTINASLYPALQSLNIPAGERPVVVIGSGGTITSAAALDLGLTSYDETMVHGHELELTAIEKLWQKMIAMEPAERNSLPCLGGGRGEILPAGLRIYRTLLELLQQKRLKVSDTGLLEGILLSGLPGTGK
jgi:exopolyphosphatase/guanosine-5'-triphosphate,3'-diphosphate pyrophosphatase